MKKIFLLITIAFISMAASAQQTELTLKSVMDGTFYSRGMGEITPMADGEHFLVTNGTQIIKMSFSKPKNTETILDL